MYTTQKKAMINRDNTETLCIITKMGIALRKKRNNLKWDYSAHQTETAITWMMTATCVNKD